MFSGCEGSQSRRRVDSVGRADIDRIQVTLHELVIVGKAILNPLFARRSIRRLLVHVGDGDDFHIGKIQPTGNVDVLRYPADTDDANSEFARHDTCSMASDRPELQSGTVDESQFAS